MSPLAETILFVFGLVGLGYLSGLTGYLKTETGDALSEFAVGVALPVLLFRTMVQADFHGAAPWALWGTYFAAATVAWVAGHLVTTHVFGRDNQAGVVGGVASAFSNLLLLGIPFMLGVFGQPGFEALSLIIVVHLPVMMLASIIMFDIFGLGKGPHLTPLQIARTFFRRMLVNPLIVGILIGLAWRLTGLAMPSLLSRLVDALAAVAGSVALFAMGLGLRKFGISGNVRPALALSFIKLGLMPASALLFAWLFDLPPLTAQVAVAAASLPAGVNSYLIAVQLGTGQALASNQMTISTGLAVLTTAFWLAVAQAVFA